MSEATSPVINISEAKLEAVLGVVGDMVASARLGPSDVADVAIEMVKRHSLSSGHVPPPLKRKRLPLVDRLARSYPEFTREEIEDAIREGKEAMEKRRRAIPTEPCMPPEEAIHDEYIVCLIDGVERSRLYRYLLTHYGMTADEYRAHFNLRPNYPVVSANLLENPNFKW